MLTAFDLLQLLGILAGIATGLSIGHACFGWVGAAVGGVLGLLAGYLVGRLPWLIAWGIFRFRIKSTSTERLRKRLETQYFISHLLIAEIVVRGEPAESFWPYVLSLLRSDSSDQRRFGWQNLRIWFPRLAKQAEGFNPEDPVEKRSEQLRKIEGAEPCAEPLPRETEQDQSLGGG